MKEEFISISKVFEFLFKNFDKLKKLDNKIINLKKREDDYGDEYYSVRTIEFLIKIDNIKYRVGHENIIEDSDDWGQAEWSESWYCSITTKDSDKPIEPKIIMNKLRNILTN